MGYWNQFEGYLLDGQFKLSNYSGTDGGSAVFLSQLPAQDQFAVVKIIRAASLEADRLSSSWKIAKDSQHTNLIRAYATSTADLDGLRILYAVLECPDASLADVIQERCLNEEEGHEFLVSCAEALHYLHQRGFIHTRIRPANIVAVAQTTKLLTDSLSRSGEKGKGLVQLDRYDAPEVNKAGYSPATDIWALGVTLSEALTQSMPTGNTDSQERSLPGPFAEIIRHCLDPRPIRRWSARQILSHLQSSASASPSIAAEPPVVTPEPVPESSFAQDLAGRTSLISSVTPHALLKPSVLEQWVLLIRNFVPLRYVVSAVLIILCLGWLVRSSQMDRRNTGSSGAVGFDIRRSPDRHALTEKSAHTGASTSSHVADSSSGTAERGRTVWRVVVYTYATTEGAQAKVQDIKARAPQLNARVLSLTGQRSHMVVVGGDMGRVEAFNLRKRLLEEGFPKDIYIQNF